MDILCHRGLWTERSQQNTLPAFSAAWSAGWGIETDLRDLDGDVVVSHDPARLGREGAITVATLLQEHARQAPHTTLALNIKADGLQTAVAAALVAHGTTSAYVFDMSVPDHLGWLRAGVPTYTRWSDVEPTPALESSSVGVWLDAFDDDAWWTAKHVASVLDAGRHVAVVSPELHGRPPQPTWDRLLAAGLHHDDRLAVCTDVPQELLDRAAAFIDHEQVTV